MRVPPAWPSYGAGEDVGSGIWRDATKEGCNLLTPEGVDVDGRQLRRYEAATLTLGHTKATIPDQD